MKEEEKIRQQKLMDEIVHEFAHGEGDIMNDVVRAVGAHIDVVKETVTAGVSAMIDAAQEKHNGHPIIGEKELIHLMVMGMAIGAEFTRRNS